MPLCRNTSNGLCASSAVHADGKYDFCATHHLDALRNDEAYRLSVNTWRISTESLNNARAASDAAQRENLESLQALNAFRISEEQGATYTMEEKERVLRYRFEAADRWVYLRDVCSELERAVEEREYIDRRTNSRLDLDVFERAQRAGLYDVQGNSVPPTTSPQESNLDARILTEFAM